MVTILSPTTIYQIFTLAVGADDGARLVSPGNEGVLETYARYELPRRCIMFLSFLWMYACLCWDLLCAVISPRSSRTSPLLQ